MQIPILSNKLGVSNNLIHLVGIFFNNNDSNPVGKRIIKYRNATGLTSGYYDSNNTWIDSTGLNFCIWDATSNEDGTYTHTPRNGTTNDFDGIYPWSQIKLVNIPIYEEVDGVQTEVVVNEMIQYPKFYLKQVNTTMKFQSPTGLVEETGLLMMISTDPNESDESFHISAPFKVGTEIKDYYYKGRYEATSITSPNTSKVYLTSTKDGTKTPKVSTNRITFTTQAQNNNLSSDGIYSDYSWNITTLAEQTDMLVPLAVIESGSRNSQAMYGNGIVSMQAAQVIGLGDPVQFDIDEYPNTLRSGSVNSGTNGQNPVVYRGLENPWGNVWKNIQGLCQYRVTDIVAEVVDETTGEVTTPASSVTHRYYYVQQDNDRTKFPNSTTGEWNTLDKVTAAGYVALSYELINANGYIKTLGVPTGTDPSFAVLPTLQGGNTTQYYCDYGWTPGAATNTETGSYVGWYTPFFGGYWSDGAACGLFYWYLTYGLGYSNTYFGSRLSLVHG